LSAGPQRPETAGRLGVPQVVSLGALDMVNFGPGDTVPAQFVRRDIYPIHNPTVTLTRTTTEESAELGRRIGRKLSAATGPTVLFVPLRAVSMIAVERQSFYSPESDAALIGASSMERLPTERTGRLRYRRQRDSPANPEHPRQDSNLRPTA
jgi:uncharacterized protein (UPF0261 family)